MGLGVDAINFTTEGIHSTMKQMKEETRIKLETEDSSPEKPKPLKDFPCGEFGGSHGLDTLHS